MKLRSNVGELWFIKSHDSGVISLQTPSGNVVPFFSDREPCETFIMKGRLEQHLAAVLDTRKDVVQFLEDIKDHIEWFTLDPEYAPNEGVKIAPVSMILEGFIVGAMP